MLTTASTLETTPSSTACSVVYGGISTPGPTLNGHMTQHTPERSLDLTLAPLYLYRVNADLKATLAVVTLTGLRTLMSAHIVFNGFVDSIARIGIIITWIDKQIFFTPLHTLGYHRSM